MPEHHKVLVVRVPEILPHKNADTLGIVSFGGYQVVVKLGDFQPGDLAIYIQPDSVLPQEPQYAFVWAGKEQPDGSVLERHRRVTVRKFRGEWSEGLLLPTIPLYREGTVIRDGQAVGGPAGWKSVKEGDDVAEFLGITHYEPPEPEACAQTHNYDRGVWPKSLKGWWYFLLRKFGLDVNRPTGGDNVRAPKSFPPVYDVEALKNFVDVLEPGEPVLVTEKVHGSNARYTFQNRRFYAGSRKLWKSPKSASIWWKVADQNPWIEKWCREHEGYVLYGEVFPTQGGYNYGRTAQNPGFLVFDILSPKGEWVVPNEAAGVLPDNIVPRLYSGDFDLEHIKNPCVDGPSKVPGAEHIREGCVIRALNDRPVRGLGRCQLKIVSNKFLERESK